MENAVNTYPEIYEQLRDVFRSVFDLPALDISDETTADDIEEWDSLMHINLIVASEEKFQTKFTTKEIQSLDNVGDFIRLIAAKVG